jgi:hypothetical protein
MNEYDWTGWTDWAMLDGMNFKEVCTGPGAYVLSVGKPINRSVGVDAEGLFDIGESSVLRQRIRNFVRCATEYGREGHMAGWRYAFLRTARHFPFEELRVRWICAESKQEARELECKVMMIYLAKHTELPPFNYSFNWSLFKKDGWDSFDRLINWQEGKM